MSGIRKGTKLHHHRYIMKHNQSIPFIKIVWRIFGGRGGGVGVLKIEPAAIVSCYRVAAVPLRLEGPRRQAGRQQLSRNDP